MNLRNQENDVLDALACDNCIDKKLKLFTVQHKTQLP